jgi:hypothetical protein
MLLISHLIFILLLNKIIEVFLKIFKEYLFKILYIFIVFVLVIDIL